jgi:DNA-binding NarL/FixJ family response regulator
MPLLDVSATESAAPLRVVLADDSFLVRAGLAQLLSLSPQLQVVAQYGDAEGLRAAIDTDRPQVVVTDIRMPPTQTDEGMRLAEDLRHAHPGVGVVVLSQHGSARYAAQLLEGGAVGRGYLLKDRIHDLEQLVETIVAVAGGECRVDVRLIDSLLQRRRPRASVELLTPRQREILADIAAGHSNLGIAQKRGLTQRAVEKHVSEIFGRLGLANDEAISRRVCATLLYLAEPPS